MNQIKNTEQTHFENFKLGDKSSFEYFYNKFHSKIVGFCIQFIYDQPESNGIAQEAFINLWTSRSKIKKISGIESFLYTFAKSKCLNVIRHNKVKNRYQNNALNERERELDYQVLKSMKFDSMTLLELEDLISKSIEKLPKKTKEVFLKKRYENKKNREIAEELNVSLKTVEAQMTKALKLLKIDLSPYLASLLLGVINIF